MYIFQKASVVLGFHTTPSVVPSLSCLFLHSLPCTLLGHLHSDILQALFLFFGDRVSICSPVLLEIIMQYRIAPSWWFFTFLSFLITMITGVNCYAWHQFFIILFVSPQKASLNNYEYVSRQLLLGFLSVPLPHLQTTLLFSGIC